MTNLSRTAVSALFAALFAMPAMAAPISFGGDWSIDIAPGSNFTVTSPQIGGNDILFTPHETVFVTSFDACGGANPCYTYQTRELSAQISADPGRIITRFSAILSYGPSNNNWGSGTSTFLSWDFDGATYQGSLTDRYGNFDLNGDFIWSALSTQWKVTGDGTTGQAFAQTGWFTGPFFGTNTFNGIPGLNFFQVNAASFSINLESFFDSFYQGGLSYGTPIQMGLVIETADAPPPQVDGVPVPGSLALAAFGLFGIGAARRRKAA